MADYPEAAMKLDEAVRIACREPTLIDALSWIAVWENDRAVHQALAAERTGRRTGADGAMWDTCFGLCFKEVMAHYPDERAAAPAHGRIVCSCGNVVGSPQCPDKTVLPHPACGREPNRIFAADGKEGT